ncbi:Dehydrogenase/reductase SDR family member 1 [Trichoplax sp. H2]|nr:Dehydrogenase/reductase SDR family member 1 [Trichoplax sp. H2]|eukprot:RDD44150.1 Dehydrogenase/reductase SDR family member 1 [Trichoplax sp. H2]
MSSLQGKVCLVTGATRGIGKGIAVILGEEGATVYITGRTLEAKPGLSGSLKETAQEIDAAGGKGIPIQCDHSKDEDIAKLFATIAKEQDGRLDVLVNNAYAGVQAIFDNSRKKFWEQPDNMWDTINGVGLRAHYIATCHASRLMVPRKQGLIVNISSAGGLRYLFNVAYGIGKAGVDRMAADCGYELKKSNVAMVSLWPGPVKTEYVSKNLNERDEMKSIFSDAEDPTFSGKAVVAMANDPNIMKKTGKIVTTADLSTEYGFTDISGNRPSNIRSVKDMLKFSGSNLAPIVPGWIRLPWWVIAATTHKF